METERPPMTREMTDRELDAEVAIKVMRWTPMPKGFRWKASDGDTYFGDGWKHKWEDDSGPHKELWNPSSSIAHAWLVVEEMRKRGWNVSMSYFSSTGDWFVSFSKPQAEIADIMCSGPSIERAICGAALAALESERAK